MEEITLTDSDNKQPLDWIEMAKLLAVAKNEVVRALVYLAIHDFEGEFRTRLLRIAHELEVMSKFALNNGLDSDQEIRKSSGQKTKPTEGNGH